MNPAAPSRLPWTTATSQRGCPSGSPAIVKETAMTSVRPHLWFGNNQAAEAARFYEKHIPESSVSKVMTAPEGVPGVSEGTEFVVEFTVAGLPVVGLNA